MSAAVALLLVTVAVGSAVAAVKLARANTKAEEKRHEAEHEREVAVTAARAANQQNGIAVDSQVKLVRLFDGKLRDVPAFQNDREQILDDLIKGLKTTAQAMIDLRRDVKWDSKDEENNWRSLARAHQAQARVSLSRNKVSDAMEEFRQMEEIVARLAAADPDNLERQVILIRTQRELGHVSMYRVGDSKVAQRYFQSALKISRACLAKEPDSFVCKSEVANSLGQLAGSELTLGHLKEAAKLYEEEVSVRESFSPAQANDWDSRRELAGLYAKLAGLKLSEGDREGGQRLYDNSAKLRQQFARERPDSWHVQNDLGLAYNHQAEMRFPFGNDPKAAMDLHRKALEIFRKRAQADPSDLDNRYTLARTLYYEATCALHSGDKAGADADYRECLKIFKELANEPKAKIQHAEMMLALARCGEYVEAAKIAEQLVETPPKDEAIYVQAACGFAVASGAARAAGGSDAALVQHYIDRALYCLRSAKDRGWANVVSLETDTDLEPIRKEPAFQALLGEFRQLVKKCS